MDRLLDALRRNRHAHRDCLIGLIIYRHGLRVSEACDLRWDDIDLPKRTITVRRHAGQIHQAGVIQPMPAPPGSERIAIRPTSGTSNGSFITLAPTCAAFRNRVSTSSTAM
jgi:integrase